MDVTVAGAICVPTRHGKTVQTRVVGSRILRARHDMIGIALAVQGGHVINPVAVGQARLTPSEAAVDLDAFLQQEGICYVGAQSISPLSHQDFMAILGLVIHYVFQVRRGIVPARTFLTSCPVLCYIPRRRLFCTISFKCADVYTCALRSDRATLILIGNLAATNILSDRQSFIYRRAAGVQSINIHISRSRRGAARLIQCFQLGGIINEVLLDQILNVIEFALTFHIDHAVFQGEGTLKLIDVRAAFVSGGVAPQDRVCQCRIVV